MTSLNKKLLLLTLVILSVVPMTGCIVRPAGVAVTATPAVVVQRAPVRVYHNGVWLYYHNGYYRTRHHGRWIAARSVPTHVRRYHRPPHVRRAPATRRAPAARHAPARRAPAHVRRR